MWSKDKIEKQREYFEEQRIIKTGKFTEFVVRIYYCIYKACDENGTNYCLESDVSNFKIKYKIYEGFYGGVPDHDSPHVIGDCFNHLSNMGYISFDDSKSKTLVVINKHLDFLLPGEHEFYKQKYNISKDIDFNNDKVVLTKALHKSDSKETNLNCTECDSGHYILRNGTYGYFYGCSNFPKCKSVKKISEFMYMCLLENGINIYEQKSNCWKCNNEISVLSYFLDIDFKLNNIVIPNFTNLHLIRLGSIQKFDKFLISKYNTLENRYSKKAGFVYTGNICPFCDSLQGAQMTLGKIHEQLSKETDLHLKVKENVKINSSIFPKEEFDEMIQVLMRGYEPDIY
ncbi:MAG: topoisomerase DNA-binding C4 zinc finger domain-containing protein [Bacilli bacterium]|nr:topoisomerase DNA-binding C4 zinc finger domain-containing protein [Bacilli bacterium]